MVTKEGVIIHPWYKGNHEWKVKGIAKLNKLIQYHDLRQGKVGYDPKILLLDSEKTGRALWFAYWISTDKTKGKLKWGQGPPVLEEDSLLQLLKEAISQNFFGRDFIEELASELNKALKWVKIAQPVDLERRKDI